MGTVVVTRQADFDARPCESPTKPEGWRSALLVKNEIFETTTDNRFGAASDQRI